MNNSRVINELGNLTEVSHTYSFSIGKRKWKFNIREYLLRDYVQFLHVARYYDENVSPVERESALRESVILFLEKNITGGGSPEELRKDLESISPEKLSRISDAILVPLVKYSEDLEKAAKKKAQKILGKGLLSRFLDFFLG